MFDRKNTMISREKVAIAMGAFDGIHKGHQLIINKMMAEAKERGLLSAVYTFNNVPKSVNRPEESIHILKAGDKYELLKEMGVDIVYMHDFDDKLMMTSREDFIKNLYQYFDIKLIVVGKDFRFGHKVQGDVRWLEENQAHYGFELIACDFFELEGEKVSSTTIRNLLRAGNLEGAQELLGRHHFIKGRVVDGRKVGRKLGFPTANVEVYPEMAVISNGVYYTRTLVKGKRFHSVTNIGNVPSFSGAPFSVETYILDFNQDIYGEEIKVEFIEKLREEIKYDNTTDLIRQIEDDVRVARELSRNCE
ncbi:MAG: bifunctional riboflavin kinase/FAD synthetase [Bacillota bacterium]|nr:bifunctional riboflavin kinase/FAD synthetase [Bacillota bacterium]